MTLEQLKEAVAEGRGVAELPHFIAFGGDVNEVLHFAAEIGNLPMMTALINSGADIEARNVDGWTALHLAVDADIDSAGQTDYSEGAFIRNLTFSTTALLVSAGADLGARCGNGKTPRDMAAEYGEQVLGKFDEVIAKSTE